MLTSSCVKLQTVHHIPLSINREGERHTVDVGNIQSTKQMLMIPTVIVDKVRIKRTQRFKPHVYSM